MRPYYEALAADDRTIGWERLAGGVLLVGILAQAAAYLVAAGRPPVHVDAQQVAKLPVERLQNVTPDLMDATGLAQDLAQRMFRIHSATIAADQAWVLNHMVPELAESYQDRVPDYIALSRKKKGEVAVEVRSLTPVQAHLPYRIEVVVSEEFRGDYQPPGKGKPDPGDPRKEEYRFLFTLVRTAKSVTNRDALLLKDVALATTR